MRWPIWALSAVTLLTDAAYAKAIAFPPQILRKSIDHEGVMRRAVADYDRVMERRNTPTTNSFTAVTSNTPTSATIATACSEAVAAMTGVTNLAGYAGCYNILSWDSTTSTFQADLRVFQQGTASSEFSGVNANDITVLLTYPGSTQFKSMTKRSTIDLQKRDGSPNQIQQLSLVGSFKHAMDFSKLNQTSLASLMVPQITLSTTEASTQQTVSTNMTASDSAYFVAGLFTNISAQAAQVVNPATASAAITAAQAFVLPGRTFGIFPTGLIVTSIWTVLFLFAFGLGTVGRLRSRNAYRRRIITLAERTRRL